MTARVPRRRVLAAATSLALLSGAAVSGCSWAGGSASSAGGTAISGTATSGAGAGEAAAGGSPSPTPSRTSPSPGTRSSTRATPPATPAPARPAAPAPARVKGYTLSPASDAERASVVKLARSYGEVLGGITVRRVRQGDTRLGTLVLHGVDPAVEGNRTVERSLVSGLLTGLDRGAKTSRTRVGGQELIVARISGATLVAWYRRGVLAIVLGSSADPVLTFAKAYVKAS